MDMDEGLNAEQCVIDLYRSMLISGDRGRKRAVTAIVALGPAAVPPLLTLLTDIDRGVGPYILDALEQIGDLVAVEPLIDLLKTGSDELRTCAARALGTLGDKRAVPVLIEALDDAEFSVRMQSTAALGKIGDTRAVEPLLARLTISKPTLDSTIARALAHIGDARAFEPLLAALHDLPRRRLGSEVMSFASALRAVGGPEAISTLLDLLTGADPLWCEIAAYGLGLPEAHRAVEPLLVALDHPVTAVRVAAASSLGVIGDERAITPLLTSGLSAEPIAPGTLGSALACLGESGEAALLALLRAPTATMRAAATDELGLARATHGITPLVQVLADDAESRVRGCAARALGAIGNAAAVDPLIAALTDPDRNVRGAAAVALVTIGDRRALEPLWGSSFRPCS